MTDRKYVILNTSIQTGSNANQLIEDAQGNVAAQIELRLPDSIFQPNEGGQKVDTVSMMTTKFRISLVDTPIASIPLNTEKTNGNTLVSTCALDIYPFTITDDGTIEPYNVFKDSTRAFPLYKSHRIYFNFYANEAQNRDLIYEVEGVANSSYIFPTNSPFYPVLKETGILDDVGYHCMNLVLNNMHGNVKIENDQMLVTDIGMLEQLISNSFANALYYASTETETYVDIDLALYEGSETLVPPPLTKTPVTFNNTQWVVWKYTSTTDILDFDNHAGFHPKVTLSENSFTISYDTAAFGNNIPIIWNTSYIQNFDMPYQTRVDDKLALFYQPPPKRVFKYGLTNNGDDGYTYTLPDDLENTVFNIICNEAMKNTFPFLPWMEVHLPTPVPISQNMYTVTERRAVTDSYKLKARLDFDAPTTFTMGKFIGYKHGDTLPIAGVEIPDDDKYYMIYQYEIPLMGRDTPANRMNQKMYVGTFSEMPGPETVVSTGSEGDMIDYIDIPPPRIEIISETTTANPQYPIGVTTLDTQYNYQPETVETTITTTIGDTFLFYSLIEGGGNSFIGPSYSGFGDWDTSSSSNVGEASSFPPLPVAHQTSTHTTVTRTITKLYDLTGIVVGIPEDSAAQQTPMVVTETNCPRTRTDLQVDVEPVVDPQIPEDVQITPNLYDEGKFYILDCSSVNLTIGQQEPIPEAQTTKFQIDTTTTTRNDRIITDYRLYTSIESGSSLNGKTVMYNNAVGFAAYQFFDDTFKPWRVQNMTTVTETAPFIFHLSKWMDGSDTKIRDFWLIQKIGGGHSIAPHRMENIVFPNNVISTTETVLPPETETDTTTTYSYDPSLTPGTVTKPYELVSTTKTSTEITGTPEAVDINDLLKKTGRIQLRRFVSDNVFTNEYYGFVDNPDYVYTPEVDNPYINSLFKDQWRPEEWIVLTVQPNIGDHQIADYNINYIEYDSQQRMYINYVSMLFMDDVTQDYSYDANIDLLIMTDPDSSINNAVNMETQTYEQKEIVTSIVPNPGTGVGNLRLDFTWSNLPTVIISPIQSYVMVLNGMQVTQEIHPINIAQAAGSSLISTIPIIENYYSLAQTLRDLHDELVVIKDTFDDAVTYKLNPSGGMERTITFSVKYITKDGRLHQLYIPKNGVFTLQLTFGLSYYMA